MNILIIKIGALGDVVRTSFVAQALKDKYRHKNPRIYWITEENAKAIFSNNPYIDEVLINEEKQRLSSIDWDLVVNLEEDEENCQFASSLKSKKILGFYYKDGKIFPTPTAKEWFDMSLLGKKPENDILKLKNKKTHRQIISEILEIKNWHKYEPFIRLTDNQRKFASDFLRRYNLSRKDLIIGINTGAADRWPKSLSIAKTVELINKLYSNYNAKVLLFGGLKEVERNKEIISKSNAPIIDTGCGNDLVEFPALISACSLLITSDSLGLHIALALKRKTICLIGPTSPAEIDMYGLGDRIIAKSECIGCYKKECTSMEKIEITEILENIKKNLKQKITVLITAFKEPNIGKAIESLLNQKTTWDYEIIISAPDNETLDIARKYKEKNKNIRIMRDPGKGKSYALNLIFSKLETDILILTDGDVYISENSIQNIMDLFLDPEIGCLSGRPVAIEDKKTKYGYWANFLFEAAHDLRKKAFENNKFIECSGYLFAFRKRIIDSIPLDVAEDSVIPYLFWEKGYRIGYSEKAKVYVKNADNWSDWIKQKIRTSKAHETLEKYVDTNTTKRVKTFGNEAKGISIIFFYPKNLKEAWWTFGLVLARLYMWINVFWDTKFNNKHYGDAWQRIESTK